MTDALSPQEIEAARKLCEAATPGPWTPCISDDAGISVDYYYRRLAGEVLCMADADFIAASRDLLPRALATIEQLRTVKDAYAQQADESLQQRDRRAEVRADRYYQALQKIRSICGSSTMGKAHKILVVIDAAIDAALATDKER